MTTAKSVLLTTSPNKDKTAQFSILDLELALSQTKITGVVSCLGHDSTKPIAWTIPSTLYFEPGLCRLAGETLIPDSIDEQKLISNRHLRAIALRTQKECLPYKDLFEEKLIGYLSKEYKLLSSTFVSCYDEGIVERYYEKLMAKVDKDGLLYLKDLLRDFDHIGQGVFKDKSSPFAVCAHSYFRKSLSRHNNLNFFFLDEFIKYANNPNITLRLKLDADVIGIAETFVPAMEFEFWRGPGFNDDVSAIKLGVTEHKMEENNKVFSGVDSTEFLWKIEGGEQTFEAEEIKNTPSLGISDDEYGFRYAHSIYDTKAHAFKHFDGAIRMYDSEKMLDRLDKDIKSAGKHSIYTKLFRIDGELPLADWKLLLHHYFQGNHLIEEYLDGKSKYDVTEIAVTDDALFPIERSFVPVSLTHNEGLRIAVSYIGIENDPDETATHYLLGHDTFDTAEFEKVVEFDIVEIRKSLARQGYSLVIPNDYKLIDCYDDLQWNIPKILVKSDNDLPLYISALLKAVLDILVAKNKPQQTVAFTFAWQEKEENKEVVISLLGTSKNLIEWLRTNPTIPTEYEKFKKWLESLAHWLNSFSKTNDIPHLNDVLYNDGTLFIKREPVLKYAKAGAVEFVELDMVLEIKEEFQELIDALNANTISYSPTFCVTKITCQKCKMDYVKCEHSSVLDEDVRNKIEGYKLLGHYWISNQ